jgi:DNA modification methylase
VTTVRLIHGDSALELVALPTASIDAMVTDPPAGIAFMGKDWDRFRRAHNPADVGRDSVHGRMSRNAPASGAEGQRGPFLAALTPIFAECVRVLAPGAHAIVWALPRTSHWTATALEDAGFEIRDVAVHLQAQGFPKSKALLKPAAEHWILARTPGPLRELAIDTCRIPANGEDLGGGAETRDRKDGTGWDRPWRHDAAAQAAHAARVRENVAKAEALGRWPANVTLECCGETPCAPDCPVRLLDAQSGERTSGAMRASTPRKNLDSYSGHFAPGPATDRDITVSRGGASRFFYCAKAKGAERAGNPHPTAKPIDLMRWLVRLVTPVGGTVLDPFMGSGTTGVAAVAETRGFVGIEREAEYAAVARTRIAEAEGPLFARAASAP